MKTIYKYPLAPGFNTISMPAHATILSAQSQERAMFLWALVDTDRPNKDRRFCVAMTGEPLPDLMRPVAVQFIGTIQIDWVVLHVFEITE